MKIIRLIIVLAVALLGILYAAASSNNPTVTLTPLSTSVTEGTGDVTVTFTLSVSEAPDKKDIEINYATANGTAIAPGNYVATSGSRKFEVGDSTPKTFSVTVHTNTPVTSNVSFTVNLTNSTNAAQDVTIPNTTATVTILNVAPPTAVNDTASVERDKSVAINVLANDIAGNNAINPATVVATSPGHGTVDVNATTGYITYTPTAGYLGSDSFTYTVRDTAGAISNSATVSVTVTYPVPVAHDNIYPCGISATISGNVITDGIVDEKQEDNLTLYAHTNPSNGTLTITDGGNGSFTYTPTAGWNGTDTFTYSIRNGYGMISNTATVTIYVNDYCINAKRMLNTDINCDTNDTNSTTGGVTSNGAQYYYFVLNEDGVLDINLTNTDPQTGGTILEYDFGNDCGTIFGKGTTSQLDAGYRSKTASMPLVAGTYYLGLVGHSKTNPTDYAVSVTFRSSCAGGGGGGTGSFTIANVGINEPGVDYDLNKSVTTKIVNKPFDLHASYLKNGVVSTYTGVYAGGKTVDMTIVLAKATDSCTNPVVIGQAILPAGSSTVTATSLLLSEAARKQRIRVTGFDYGALLADASGLNCGSSSLNSSLCLVPACFNNIQNIRSVFPPAFQPNVMTCIYGDGTGYAAPCDSNAYYGNCGGRKLTISPAKYNNDLGCAMCLADAVDSGTCSDNFAVRPDRFAFNLTNPGSPNLLRSGDEHNITIHAYDATTPGVDSVGYDQTSANLSIAAIKRMPITDAVNNDLNGTASFPSAFAFANGLSGSANMTFDDVGKITVDLNDTNWAIVDENDTALIDRTVHGEGNFTYIPYQFKVSGPVRLVDSKDGNFTYYSNVLNDVNMTMSAKFDLNVTSQNKQGNTTYNFDSASWEHPISALPNVIDSVRGDANESNITDSAVGFAAGVKHLAWNDANSSRVLKFNFPRDPSVPWDPAEVNATEANISISATYTDTYLGVAYTAVPENNATNKAGATNGTVGNAIFLYGRADAPNFRFPNRNPDAMITHGCGRIYFEFYNTVPNNPLVLSVFGGTMPPLSLTPDRFWYQNILHDTATDGNVTGIATPPVKVYGFNDNHNNTCIGPMFGPGFEKRVFEYDAEVAHGGFGYPFKSTAILNATDWLNVTGNNFGVEFYKEGKWIGEKSGTETATDHDAETVTNRRILW